MLLATANKIEMIKAIRDMAHFVREHVDGTDAYNDKDYPRRGGVVRSEEASPMNYGAFDKLYGLTEHARKLGFTFEHIRRALTDPSLCGLKECKDFIEEEFGFYYVSKLDQCGERIGEREIFGNREAAADHLLTFAKSYLQIGARKGRYGLFGFDKEYPLTTITLDS